MYGELPSIQTTSGDTISGFPVLDQVSGKTCVLRLPTNDEIIQYFSVQRSHYKDLGRRRGETVEIPNPQADAKLFNAIRLGNSPEDFDEAEMLYAINQVLRNEVEESIREGQTYRISLNTYFGKVEHVIGVPSRKQIWDYQRKFFASRDLPHNLTERRFPPEVPIALFDACIKTSEGYLPSYPVPPHHKRTVVSEMMMSLAELEPGFDPN